MFIEDGLTCLQPVEVKAGMDLIELKKNFGQRLAFMGGIDVRAMADKNHSVIEDETRRKISFAKKGGGYIYHSDHSIPDKGRYRERGLPSGRGDPEGEPQNGSGPRSQRSGAVQAPYRRPDPGTRPVLLEARVLVR